MEKPRAQLKRAYLDVDFRNQPKIRALARVHGLISQLALIDIYLAMSKATNALVDEDCIMAIAEECGVTDPASFLAYSLEKGLIHKYGSLYSNTVVIKDQEQYGKKLGKKPNSSGKNFPEKSDEIAIPDNDNDSDNDSEIDLDPKKPSSGAAQVVAAAPLPEADLRFNDGSGHLGRVADPPRQTLVTSFPFALEPKFDTPQIREYIAKVRDKFKAHRRSFDQTQFEALCMRRGCDPKLVLDSLVYTVSLTEARNIIDPPEKPAAPKGREPPRLPEWKPPDKPKPPTPEEQAKIDRARSLIPKIGRKIA